MAIKQRSYLYEVLLRFDAAGYKGSAVRDIEEVYETKSGEIIASKELPARPVTLEEVGPLIGESNADFIVNLETALGIRTAELAEATAKAVAAAERAEERAASAEHRLAQITALLNG